ncbi:Major facilitator superfamily domain, general substrate transporter [Cordyceps fumosorosea ARSEF 2679]|uniref:Major facilitator superfamily domain, general substrate transporter n=1 Tax=Cordyceps fumosorosea (strain ARSEF 2679) TaxID=1081104 RepID=A0A162LLE9_CORFA|nr:Major facilitator superfamily domain, general substrate transporter [Cordyceps fumosorosea ARSEF 2679]OAA72334.1 Major facilitator superfamily domain, general substrate transporter [Cordyceps fumosorosea ARSEF 2679]
MTSQSDTMTKLETEEMTAQTAALSMSKAETNDAPPMTPAEEKALVRKIDRNLMPLLLISYALQFFDKTSLGYTAILGIQEDTHLKGTDYAWVSSIFYFGYLIASYPASLAFIKLPLGKFLAACVVVWAVVLGCHGAATGFGNLMALRFLLGVFESTISPGFSLVTSVWYKPSEHAARHGIWFAGNTTAAIFGGLLAYAISHIKTDIAAWRWLFIIFGLVTFVWGIVLLVFLPDSPLDARFLTQDERAYALRRPQQQTHSFKTTEWKREQFVEALCDPKTWLLCIYTICTSLPNGGYTSFSGIIIQGFGFSTFTTLLLGMPGSAFGLFFVLAGTYLAHKFKYSRCIIAGSLQLIALVGCVMVYASPTSQKWTRLGGMWLFPAYAAGFPLSLSIIGSDIAGYTKKTTVLAILFIGYCAGNIAGPQMFITKQAPRYQGAFQGIMISMIIASISMLALRQYMVWDNKRRDRDQGVCIDPEAGVESTSEHLVRTGLDETDWQNKRFRYFL